MTDITIAEVHDRLGSQTQLVDVREPHEVAEGMIPGARSIPLGQLPERLTELDLARPIVAICRSGNRSGQATAILTSAGFAAENMAGGMLAWQAAGLPVVHDPESAGIR